MGDKPVTDAEIERLELFIKDTVREMGEVIAEKNEKRLTVLVGKIYLNHAKAICCFENTIFQYLLFRRHSF